MLRRLWVGFLIEEVAQFLSRVVGPYTHLYGPITLDGDLVETVLLGDDIVSLLKSYRSCLV